jgi:hypothetical protein
MSVFKGHDDLSLNRYYYSFYSFSQDDPNTIKSFVYDQNQTLVSSKDISFNTRNIPDMLSFLENSESNPYALGKSNDEFLNMDIAFTGVYKKALTEKQQQSLMTSINKTYKNVFYGTVNTFTIQVTQSANNSTEPVFIFNGDTSVENPMVPVGTVGLYIFDQSHPSNAGFPIAFRDIQSPFTPYTNVIVEGTPGTPNSYSLVSITDVSAPLLVEYYTTSTETNAEFIFGELLNYLYQVKVETNIVGDPVFGIQSPGQSAYVLQPDLSFNIGDLEYFYVGDDSMTDISLVFGPTVDDTANVVGSPYYVKMGDIIRLDLTSYDGDRLVYFEDSSNNMGYAPANSFHQTPTTDVPVSRQPYVNPSKEFNVIKYNNPGDTNTFTLENTQLILDFINEHYDGNTLTVSTESASAFKESQRVYYMHNDTIYYLFLMWFNATWVPPAENDNYYSVISENNTDLEANYPNGWGPRDYWLSDYGTGSGTSPTPVSHVNGTNVGNNTTHNSVDYASIGIPSSGNITVYYGDPLIPLSNVEYTITVVSGVFHVDGSPTPTLSLINGVNYVFDQSDSTNTGNTLVIGTAFDVSVSIVSSGLTIMGTPGQPGAYTHYVSDGSPVYYFSYQNENMGLAPPNITDDLYVHYDFELPLYDANGTAYSTDVSGGSNAYSDKSIRFYNKAYDSITNSDISYNMYVIIGNLVNDTFKVGSSSFKTFESPDKYGASRVGDYSFRLNSTQGYSICFWMKEVAKNFTPSQFLPLCAFGNGAGGGGFFQMEYNDSTFKVNNNGINITYNISSLPITEWNHIAFTMSPDGPVITWKLYINGNLVNTKTDGNYLTSVNPVSGYPTDSVYILDISAKPGGGGNNGFIDDFRFYKTEISQAQVSAVYSYTG